MARLFVTIALATAGTNFLYPKLCEVAGLQPIRFVDMVLYLPAILIGSWHWCKARTFATCWPVLVCVALVWAGLLYTGNTESSRGWYIAALVTMVLPVSALVAENRLWLYSAKVYTLASASALAAGMWFEWQAGRAASYGFLFRFGFLTSQDGHTRLGNPNQIGGQMALAAVLAFILYLNGRTDSAAGPEPAGAAEAMAAHRPFSLGWTIWLSTGCLLTASRGAFVAWLAGMSMLFIWGTRSQSPARLRDLVFLGMLGVSLAAVATVSGRWTPWEKLQSRFVENTSVGSLGNRTEIWKNAYRAWRATSEFTFRGTGTGMADEVLARFDPYSVEDQYGVLRKNCHNAFVEWALSFGIVGMVPGVCLLLTMVYQAQLLDRSECNVGRLAVLATVVVYAMTAVVYRQPQWMATGSLVLAMLSGQPAASQLPDARNAAGGVHAASGSQRAQARRRPVPSHATCLASQARLR